MTTTTGPRPMTDAEREAFTLHLQKVPVPTIQAKTGLVPSQIAAAVDLGQVHARQAMQSSTAVLLEAPAQPKPPAITVKSAAAAPTDNGRMPIGQLLTWAEQSGPSRAKTLAARVRTHLDELRVLHTENDARAKAQAEVDRLSAELEAAKAKLRAVGTGAPRPGRPAGNMPAPDRKEFLAAVRRWAAANGQHCNPLGRIPEHILQAYRAATGNDR